MKVTKIIIKTTYAKRPPVGRPLTSVALPTPEAVRAAYAPPKPRRGHQL
jgi:hypothetical protein